jgi:outer membrane protein TolC
MNCQDFFRTIGFIGLTVIGATPQRAAAEVRRLTLEEAVHLAVSQNRALKIARLKVDENQQKKAGDRSAYFPSITNQSNALHITELQNVVIPGGLRVGRRNVHPARGH